MRTPLLAGLAVCALTAGGWGQAGQPNASYLEALARQPALPAVRYTVDLTHPGNHLAGVTMVLPTVGSETTMEMPAWYPGRYSIYNFAANVQQAQAFCQDGGAALPFSRSGPNAWVISSGVCPTIRWQYRVYGDVPLNGSFFQLDNAHANLNGGPVYMYAQGEKPNPVQLTILAPSGWRVLDELGQLNQTRLWFPNYDIFIDAPLEAAPDFTLDTFHAGGKTYRVLIHDFSTAAINGANRARLLDALAKIAASENAIIGPDDLDTYTFFLHFQPGSSDGMEHLFGTQIMIGSGLATAGGLYDAEADAAHEFFHQWNVKRIRPVALGPFDYEAENPTPSLWVAEGFTEYYGDITMERTGLESSAEYLSMLGDSLGDSLHAPEYAMMSAEDASLTAWWHDATPLLQETNRSVTTVSYYDRGEQIAATLDLDLRRRTQGQKSLNDVMRWLWTNTWRAPRTNYYLPGRGYTDADVERAVETVAGGASYAQFFSDYVRGTRPIPYNQYLAAAGLELSCQVPAERNSYAGLALSGDTVREVAPETPAAQAGFGRDQVIVSINGIPFSQAGATPNLGELPPGRPARVTITEHGVTAQLTLTPEPPRATACTLIDLPQVTPAEQALRQSWLHPTP